MPHSYCVENCSNNAKSQPNLNFIILPSDKQWCQYWLQAINEAPQCLNCAKEVYLCSFVTKSNQACIKYSP